MTPDSLPAEGVPKGTVTRHVWDKSRIFPDTVRDYWVYVPAQYRKDRPASVMVFQDGGGYVDIDGPARAPNVFDNLIHKREMPVTIGIFINPGEKEYPSDQRSIEYDTLDDTYARFLLEEILPEISRDHNLKEDAESRAVCGMSAGGICSFTVAWERPDAFSKAVSHVGSYTDCRGGHAYPSMVRKTRGSQKPIRVFMQDGLFDLNIEQGDWTLGNLQMASALMYARYDHKFILGEGGHNLNHGGAALPDALRWLWRGYPGVRESDTVYSNPESVVGDWDVVMHTWEGGSEKAIRITREGDGISAVFTDEGSRDLHISDTEYRDEILSFDITFPQPAAEAKMIWQKMTGGSDSTTMNVWAKVAGGAFKGALSPGIGSEFDFSIKGQRRS